MALCVNIGSGNGLLHGSTKPLLEPVLKINDAKTNFNVSLIYKIYVKKMSFVKWKLFCQAVLFWEVPRRLDNAADFQYWMEKIFICNWVYKPKHAHLVRKNTPDSKVYGANMGPTWVLSAPDGPHVGPMNLAIRDTTLFTFNTHWAHQNCRHYQMHFS